MRIYFLSCAPAILKLNGEFAGRVDLFERYVDVNLSDNIMAEIVPGGDLQPVNFFLDEKLPSAPPDFIDLYLSDGEILIYIRRFAARSARLEVIYQARFQGNLITLFSQGETCLSIEGDEYSLIPLGDRFKSVTAEEKTLNGFPVLALTSGRYLIVNSHTGRQIYTNEVEFAEFGDSLKTCVQLKTSTCAEARCEYAYDGNELTLVAGKTVERQPPGEDILHFAFFESVMISGDYEKYLSPELVPNAADLREYLGNYTGVTVPTEKFRSAHPQERAAGLVYPERRNLFKIKYFAVQIKNGKIDNLYPVE